jgi:mRNA-degrading endonuclease RelE of RelBE toxin-antitoxin system
MSPRIRLTNRALQDLRRLDRQVATRVIDALDRLGETGAGDVRRLHGAGGGQRLRVGDWRVRLEIDRPSGLIIVNRILPRGRAYRD